MLGSILARVRSILRGIRHRDDIDAEMNEEFLLHIELRAADLVRAGMRPEEALRTARREFGNAARFREEGIDSRGLRGFDAFRVSWLDFKLGFRMLGRYPGLTLVGGVAIAFAIWLGAGSFEFVSQLVDPKLPLPEGERIVALRLRDASSGGLETRALHDFTAWREQLRTVREVGAHRSGRRNLAVGDAAGSPVDVAEISASAFRLTRVAPLLGRYLVEEDEQAGAPDVVVVGHDVWKSRFEGDPEIIGRTLRLGGTEATVVGVMPPGYAFPVYHQAWVPLRVDVLEHARGEGPSLTRVFGRLAPGATLEEARAELTALGARMATDFPRTHAHLRPEVLPYASAVFGFDPLERMALRSVNVFLALFVVLVCGNVAMLMFARTATREGEIVVRTALGASRSRIIMQLFAEALVLGGVAALVGLAAAEMGLSWGLRILADEMRAFEGAAIPFWIRASLSPATVLYALLLTLIGAVIAGVVPALKVTRALEPRLRRVSAGGGGLRFGGIWTAVIVAQVAVTVAFPATAWLLREEVHGVRSVETGFAAEEYLSVKLGMERESASSDARGGSSDRFRGRFNSASQQLKEMVAADPAVNGVAFATLLPRMYHPHRLIELDEGGGAPLDPRWPAYRVSSASIDADYLDVVRVPVSAGRAFSAADAAPGSRVVLVNEPFVQRVLGGRHPIGRQFRYRYFEEWREPRASQESPWFEIVGVVPDMGMSSENDPKIAGIYHPLVADTTYPLHMAIHVRGPKEDVAARLRAIAADVDPALRLDAIVPLPDVIRAEVQLLEFWVRLTLLVSLVAIALSLAGIYAVMSFTVAQRTREIGIRVALGASASRVAAVVFARPLGQITAGIAAGIVLVALLTLAAAGGDVTARGLAMLAGYAVLMLGVCLLACVVPTRRALAVEPREALQAEV